MLPHLFKPFRGLNAKHICLTWLQDTPGLDLCPKLSLSEILMACHILRSTPHKLNLTHPGHYFRYYLYVIQWCLQKKTFEFWVNVLICNIYANVQVATTDFVSEKKSWCSEKCIFVLDGYLYRGLISQITSCNIGSLYNHTDWGVLKCDVHCEKCLAWEKLLKLKSLNF